MEEEVSFPQQLLLKSIKEYNGQAREHYISDPQAQKKTYGNKRGEEKITIQDGTFELPIA